MTPKNRKIRIIIVGAGKAGELISSNLNSRKDSPFDIVGFVDDDKTKSDKQINKIPVLGNINRLPALVDKYGVDEIFFAVPSERGSLIRKVVQETSGRGLVYKILPRLPEVLMQSYKDDYLKFIRKVRAEDLLGGEILKADQKDITDYAKAQTVMITGAAGSIGSELSRQIAAHSSSKIILFDWWENGMFALNNELIASHPNTSFEFIIGDVKDRTKVRKVIATHKPDTIFHAAAYKHVPLMEENPAEAVKNNIIGTKTVAEVAIKHGVNKFVLVSSDKAVNPTNIMGATKRAAEKIIHILAESQDGTIFTAVRFGNVVNSNGSVIPTFKKQIEKGGPVTVTHRNITRYFMTIPEAVHLILQSWVMGENNDLFVLDMGEPIKIYNLAKLLVTLQGYEPERNIAIEVTGLRPGEKLYEEVLVCEEQTKSTSVKKIFRTRNYMSFDKLAFVHKLNTILDNLDDGEQDIPEMKQQIKGLISTYKPKD